MLIRFHEALYNSPKITAFSRRLSTNTLATRNKAFAHIITEESLPQVSDDEDETHPNIDTPSLFKWRHEARLEREAEFKKKKQELFDKVKKAEQEVEESKKAHAGLTGGCSSERSCAIPPRCWRAL